MHFDKLEKILLLISSVVYVVYIGFVGGMINLFREYVGNEYLRTKIVDQIREQTRLTQDSANVSTKAFYLSNYGTTCMVILCTFSSFIFTIAFCDF